MTGPNGDGPAPEGGAIARRGGMFTLEGRAAPGLYLVGWLASIMGAAILVVALLSGETGLGGLGLTLAGTAVLAVGLVSAAGSQAIERHARGLLGYAGPSPVLTFAATLPVTVLLAVVVLVPARALGLKSDSPLETFIGLVLTAAVYVGLIRLLVVGTGSLDWSSMGLHRPTASTVEDVGWALVLVVPVFVVTVAIALLLRVFINVTPDSALPASNGAVELAINLLSAAVIAPVGEEIFFRGFTTTAWARSMPAGQAILRGAIFFAVAHILTVGGSTFGDAFARAFVAFVTRLPFAFTLGWLFLRRRSLYAPTALHATYNALVVLLSTTG